MYSQIRKHFITIFMIYNEKIYFMHKIGKFSTCKRGSEFKGWLNLNISI